MWAAKRGHIAMAELLLERGADLLEKSKDADRMFLRKSELSY